MSFTTKSESCRRLRRKLGGERAGDYEIVVERRAHVGNTSGRLSTKALIGNFPGAPIARRVLGEMGRVR